MPWKECNPVDERLKFVARLLDGDKMAGLCREFGISRKTGYKILTRYNEIGLHGLDDRSRRPRKSRVGARRRSERSCAASIRMSTRRRSAQCMPCSTAMAW